MTKDVPIQDVHAHLKSYGAQGLPEYSNSKRHVYFAAPVKKYITVRRRGDMAELEFTTDCPCTYDD
jgi:hypothetical protein